MIPGMALPRLISRPYPICIFSKCLQFLDYRELGDVISELGFDGVDLTVRPGGHIPPEHVKRDLPEAVRTIRRAGVEVPMIATSVNDVDDPFTEHLLGTAADSGITCYRMGALQFDKQLGVFENLDIHRRKLEKLEKINRKYKIRGGYQNHSGPWGMMGGAVWDLYHVLKDFDPAYIGVQYDIAHATVEGGFSWELALEIITPWINSLAIKDFIWAKEGNKWYPKWVPVGKGMVNYEKYLDQINPIISALPLSLHFEYDLGGAEHGNPHPTMAPEKIYELLKQDLHYFISHC